MESAVDYQQDVLVVEATKSIEAATALLPKLVTDYIDRKSLARQVLEKQKSEAQARLRQAETRKERGTMTSPVDGIVLDRQESNERFLAGGEVLLEDRPDGGARNRNRRAQPGRGARLGRRSRRGLRPGHGS